MFTHFESVDELIEDVRTNKKVQKSVFVCYFQTVTGPQSALREKINRLCLAYNVNQYGWPRSATEATERMLRLEEFIHDKSKALDAYQDFFVAECSALLEVHRVREKKEKKRERLSVCLFVCLF